MVFSPNIPTASQKLSASQPLLLANNQQLDTSFGIDHYKFSDGTANNGFHNKVETPEYSTATDPVTTANPIFYALEDTVNLGLLQFSRGPNNAARTPVTSLHSTITPITVGTSSSINILDFTGISIAMCTLYCFYVVNGPSYTNGEFLIDYRFNGTAKTQVTVITGSSIVAFSGNILRITNNNPLTTFSDMFWTLKFHRLQV
jgi:hypothetical protein